MEEVVYMEHLFQLSDTLHPPIWIPQERPGRRGGSRVRKLRDRGRPVPIARTALAAPSSASSDLEFAFACRFEEEERRN